ncbi:DUF1905 domain-containing protein [Methylophilus sp. 3sh_L]|uniref:DUF1905 domain-containing protein n=1 Tax=Methylophilus sp. 3sh_L TaxID=3377114 RepID=UPI00398E3BFC
MDGLEYTFTDVVRLWQGSKSSWHYVSLPQTMSDEIHTLSQYHQSKRRGWGAVKVVATVLACQSQSILNQSRSDSSMPGESIIWQTSIFPAFDHKRYALFLKAEIRKRAELYAGDEVTIQLQLQF